MKNISNDRYYQVNGVSELFKKDQTNGVASISQFEFKPENDFLFNLRAAREHPMFIIRAGKYVRLHVDGQLMMSDTGMERISNKEFIHKANGRVLVAGLGLGLIIHNIIEKDNVSEIVVIEKYKDVIDLVAPKFKNKKLTIIHADIFDWRPQKGQKFNTIYFDIWPEICTDNLKQIKELHNAFKSYKAVGGWMESWMKTYLQRQRYK